MPRNLEERTVVQEQEVPTSHDCTMYANYMHGANSIGGNGDDYLGNVENIVILRNNLIGRYNPKYAGHQHQDGCQTADWVWFEGNYVENVANYAYFGEFASLGNRRPSSDY